MTRVMRKFIMGLEADSFRETSHGERDSKRTNQSSRFKSQRSDMRVGAIDLSIQKLGLLTYFPESLLESRRRSEQAILKVIAKRCLFRDPAREVNRLVHLPKIDGISKPKACQIAKQLDTLLNHFRNKPFSTCEYPVVGADASAIVARIFRKNAKRCSHYDSAESTTKIRID